MTCKSTFTSTWVQEEEEARILFGDFWNLNLLQFWLTRKEIFLRWHSLCCHLIKKSLNPKRELNWKRIKVDWCPNRSACHFVQMELKNLIENSFQICFCSLWTQRTHTVWGSIIVRLVSSFTSLDSTDALHTNGAPNFHEHFTFWTKFWDQVWVSWTKSFLELSMAVNLLLSNPT